MRHLIRRRTLLTAALGAVAASSAGGLARPALARTAVGKLSFDGLYGSFSALGLTFSQQVLDLTGKDVAIAGFMAPPLKAEANFFVLTEIPMALCPFCSTDADWPDNIMVVYLAKKQTFTPPNQRIQAQGTLERGSWTDPDTGFVSQLRLRDARFAAV